MLRLQRLLLFFLFLFFKKIPPQLELFLEILEVLVLQCVTVLAVLFGQNPFVLFEV
jgi:hypothetical protein